MVGKKEEHRAKDIPGKKLGCLDMVKSVLKAQNGMRAELVLDVIWGGWLTWKGSLPDNNVFSQISRYVFIVTVQKF